MCDRYLEFEQTKCGFTGTTLAPVGGFIEKGEKAIDAAKREVSEETGLEAQSWDFLGSYRVAANRGAGVWPFPSFFLPIHLFFFSATTARLQDIIRGH